MRIYADRPATALRQLVTDLLVAAWVYGTTRAALWLHDLVLALAVPGTNSKARAAAWPTISIPSATRWAGYPWWATN